MYRGPRTLCLAMRALIASLFLTILGASSFALVVNGDFETDLYADGTAPSITSLTGWTILGTGDVHGVGTGYLGSDSDQVDVSGYADTAGSGIVQTLATVNGQAYTLTFELFVPITGSIKVQLNGSDLDTGIGGGLHSYNFLGTGSDTLSFINEGTGITTHLDDVAVEAVPEPATLAILGLGLAAARRRRAK